MRKARVINGWKLTPAISRSTYPEGKEVRTVTKVVSGEDSDGYHVESLKGSTFFVSYYEDDRAWRSETLKGQTPEGFLVNPSKSLTDIVEKLALREKIRELEGQLNLVCGVR